MANLTGISDAIHAAIYSTLTGDVTLMALITGVYDDVPDATAYPYVQMASESWSSKDATFSKDARSVLIRIHARSQYAGAKEAWSILGRIGILLDETALTVTGATVEAVNVEASNVITDSDGRTRHGVVDVRIQLAET